MTSKEVRQWMSEIGKRGAASPKRDRSASAQKIDPARRAANASAAAEARWAGHRKQVPLGRNARDILAELNASGRVTITLDESARRPGRARYKAALLLARAGLATVATRATLRGNRGPVESVTLVPAKERGDE